MDPMTTAESIVATLEWKADASHKVLEPSIGTKGVEVGLRQLLNSHHVDPDTPSPAIETRTPDRRGRCRQWQCPRERRTFVWTASSVRQESSTPYLASRS